MAKTKRTTTAAQAKAWEISQPLLGAMYREFQELSKKKPDGPLSKPKITVVNRLLDRCRAALKGEDSLEFLDLLNEDEIPQNSDVALMLSQYVSAMESFHKEHWNYREEVWLIK